MQIMYHSSFQAVCAHLQALMAFAFICKLSGTSQCLIFSGTTLFSFLHVNRHSCVSLSCSLWLSLFSSGLNHVFSARYFWNFSLMDEGGGRHPLQVVPCQVLHRPGVCRWNHKIGGKVYKQLETQASLVLFLKQFSAAVSTIQCPLGDREEGDKYWLKYEYLENQVRSYLIYSEKKIHVLLSGVSFALGRPMPAS